MIEIRIRIIESGTVLSTEFCDRETDPQPREKKMADWLIKKLGKLSEKPTMKDGLIIRKDFPI